jgi:hypothetical protein
MPFKKLSLVGLIIAMSLSRSGYAEPTTEWLPTNVDGEAFEARILGEGHWRLRTDAKKWGEWQKKIDQSLAPFVTASAGLNLPAKVKTQAIRLRAEINRLMTKLGPQAEFTQPPSFGWGMINFTFVTPDKAVSVMVMEMNSEHTGTPQMSLTVTPLVDGKWQKEAKRFRSIMFSIKGPEALAAEREWKRVRYGEAGRDFYAVEIRDDVGDTSSNRKNLASVQVYKLPQPDRWLVSDWRGRKAKKWAPRLMLAGGKEVALDRRVAERLFHLNRHEFYLPLAKDHPDHTSGLREFRNVRVSEISKYGVQLVVDKRGRTYFRRGKTFDAQGLKKTLGLAFVKRSVTGHRAHLRQLRQR